MLAIQTAGELRCRRPLAEVLTRLWGCIEGRPAIAHAPGISAVGGSIGGGSFTIRYSGFDSAVRVEGALRRRESHSAFSLVSGLAGAEYWDRRLDGWAARGGHCAKRSWSRHPRMTSS